MKFVGTLVAPRINFSLFNNLIKQELSELISLAAFEWLGAVTQRVPVWSGASRATFLPLAHAVGYQLSISPSSTARDRVSLGLQNASGSIDVDPKAGKYTFSYATSLAHLIWNEFNNANISPDPTKFPPPTKLIDPGPYEFQKLGKEAFDRVAAGVRLPNPFNSLKVKLIRVK